VHEIAPQIPKPTADDPLVPGLTIEQRLLESTAMNLKRLVRDLDRPGCFHEMKWNEKRHWARRNLMAFLGHQICYAASTGRPVPVGSWQALHDFFVYLVFRTGLRLRQPFAKRRRHEDQRFEQAYKRLLLLGLTLAASPTHRVDRPLQRRLTGWALDAWLMEPDHFLGQNGLILVEVAKDAPPRREPATLYDPFRGWVLSPPDAFLEHLETTTGPPLPHSLSDGETPSIAA